MAREKDSIDIEAERDQLLDLDKEQLIDRLISTKRTQAGQDRKNRELVARLNELDDPATQIKQRERQLKLKEELLNRAAARGVPTQIARHFAVTDDEGIDAVLDDFLGTMDEKRFADNRAHDAAHGRKLDEGERSRSPNTYGDLLKMSDDNLNLLSPELIASLTKGASNG